MKLQKIISTSLLLLGCELPLDPWQPRLFCASYNTIEFPITDKKSWEIYCKMAFRSPFMQRGIAGILGEIADKKLEKACVKLWDGSQAGSTRYLSQPDFSTCQMVRPPGNHSFPSERTSDTLPYLNLPSIFPNQ